MEGAYCLDGDAMNTASIYVCVYARHLPAQALLRLRPTLKLKPVAVMEGERPWERVCSHNRQAAALGMVMGMTRAEAELFAVQIMRRSVQEEEATKSALLTYLALFSPRIEDQSTDTECAYILDLVGTERLFGTPQAIAARIHHHALEMGLTVLIAISSNFYASVCLCRSSEAREAVLYVAAGEERKCLATLPISALLLSKEHAETLNTWGVRTLGELALFSETDLIVRLGQEGKRLRQRARGEYAHYFRPVELPCAVEEFIEFDGPVDVLESLLFILNPLLEQLVLRAQSRALSLASMTVVLGLEKAPEHARTIRPALPSSDRGLLLKLLHLDLSAHPPCAGVLSIKLTAEQAAGSKMQLGLFSPQSPDALQLDVTLARIAALVGEDRVGYAQLKDTHQLDAFTIERFTIGRPVHESLKTRAACSTLRRLRPPLEVMVGFTARRIDFFFYKQTRYTVEQSYGPWQTSGSWWSTDVWSSESWDIVGLADRGQMLVCQLSHDRLRNQWHVDALYD